MKRKFIPYDIFKLVVAILLVLLLLFVFKQCAPVVPPTFDALSDDLVEGPNEFIGVGSKEANLGLLVNDSVGSEFMSDAEGNWSTEAALVAGENAVQAVQYNKKGEVVAESEVQNLIARYATVTPSFELPEGDLVEGMNTLSGVGTPMAAMGVLVDGELVSEFTADADGNWSTDVDLPAGAHTIQVVELDADGAVVVASDEKSVDVAFATLAPSMVLPEGKLVEGMNTFTGTGTPMALMGLMVNGELVSEFTADADGNWTTDVDLAAGENNIQVVELDADGTIVAESEIYPLSTDYAMVTPSLNLPEAGFVVGMNALTGSGTPMAAMGVLVNGELVSEFTADADGKWNTDLELAAGDGEIQIVQFDADGTIVAESEVYSLNADYATVAPVLTLPEGELTEGMNTLSGLGTPMSALGMMVNESMASEFAADADGAWSTDVELVAGENTVQVVQHDTDGKVVAESEKQTLTAKPKAVSVEKVIDEVPDTSDCGTGKVNQGLYVVNYCQNLTRIAEALNVDLDALLAANPEITDANLIFPGQRLVIPQE